MNPLSLLHKDNLTPEEEATLERELSAAYHMDEAAATSCEVQRVAEKIRLRMLAEASRNHPEEPGPESGSPD